MKLNFKIGSLLCILFLAGCDDSRDNSDKTLSEKINSTKTIIIGTEGTYPPFTFHDKNDNLVGFDIDVVNEVAKRLNLKTEFKETLWDAMFAGLNSGRFDMIANQVGVSKERQEKYSLSIPYSYSTAVVLVNENNNDIRSFNDVKDKVAAQTMTSNWNTLAKSYGAKIESVDGFAQATQLVANGSVDLTFGDRLTVLDLLRAKPNSKLKIGAISSEKKSISFALRKEDQNVTDIFNNELIKMKEDGTLKNISIKWFGEDVSI